MGQIRHPSATTRSRAERRKRAESLVEERGKRDASTQLTLLDRRLGKDQGAKRERAKLAKELSGGSGN